MIREKLLTILGLKNTLATNINAKGVEASTTDGMTTLVPKVSEIQVGDPNMYATSDTFVCKYSINIVNYIGSDTPYAIDTLKYLNCYNPRDLAAQQFRYYTALEEVYLPNMGTTQTTSSYYQHAFSGCTNLRICYIPSVKNLSSYFFYSCTSLVEVYVGTLVYCGVNTWGYTTLPKSNMRLLSVGQGTDINISTGSYWTATNVIAEGEASCLELINNARTGLYDRVADHRGEGLVRTITASWVGTLSESEYTSVTDALEQLMTDFAEKGWTLQG